MRGLREQVEVNLGSEGIFCAPQLFAPNFCFLKFSVVKIYFTLSLLGSDFLNSSIAYPGNERISHQL